MSTIVVKRVFGICTKIILLSNTALAKKMFKTLPNIEGVEGRINNVVYQEPIQGTSNSRFSNGHVVYFPGDVQDFKDSMLSHPQNCEWDHWCYENTLSNLAKKFSNCHIWLVLPKKKMYQIFAIYSNFIKIESLVGVPTYTTDHKGLLHLEHLLTNCINEVSTDIGLHKLPLCLVGFSKGCNVLNQFINEASNFTEAENSATEDLVPSKNFMSRITDIYWLDGGHSGNKDVWVTDESVLSCLKNSVWSPSLNLHIHVTPYQVKDTIHPWKGEEHEMFVNTLQELGVRHSDKLHFDKELEEDEKPSLLDHFRIIEDF